MIQTSHRIIFFFLLQKFLRRINLMKIKSKNETIRKIRVTDDSCSIGFLRNFTSYVGRTMFLLVYL